MATKPRATSAERPQDPPAAVIGASGFRLLKSEIRPLTKELAIAHRDLTPSPTERELDPKRLKYLREKAEAGQLVTFHWATAKLGNDVMRMNGMHSSTMLCDLNGAFPEDLQAHFDHYEVASKEGLAQLFRQFDPPKSSRTPLDVSGAFQGLYDDLNEVPRREAKLAIDGVAWYRRNVEGVPVAASDNVYTLFGDHGLHPFLLWIGELFSIKTPELKVTQILSAMYATYGVNEEQAQEFWVSVAREGVAYEDDAPATVLDSWLKWLKENPKDKPRTFKPASYYQGCVYAWNAFREGKTLKEIKWNHKAPLQAL